jgi:hypothetical protein
MPVPGKNRLKHRVKKSFCFLQKLRFIHENAVRAGMCKMPEEYKYSSALFYEMPENKSILGGR